ncbi:helix-turn-helix domain-containing protein [Streptococcus uberis]|nr:helix-turn-helix domain-containing protein [Streptococcus uberis]
MNRLKELREKNSLTQQELADKIGVSKRTLGYWEKGKQIKPDQAKKLAEYFEVSVGYLLGFTDNPKQYIDEEVDSYKGIGLLASSNERSIEEHKRRLLTEFVRFFADHSIWISNNEINLLLALALENNLNNGVTLKSRLFLSQRKKDDYETSFLELAGDEYSYVFGEEFERDDIEFQIDCYILEEMRIKEKREKLLQVLKDYYGERDYLD